MARRKDNLLTVLLGIFAKLPWWAGVLAAAIAYPLLHHYAVQPPPPFIQTPGQLAQTILPNMIRAASIIGQYLLPLIFLAGAAMSAIGRAKRKQIADTVAQSTQADPLKGLSWGEFEQLVGEAFRRRGYQVIETPPGPDGGVDLVLRKEGETYLVQCKHWRATKVGVPIVRELFGVMADRGAAGAFVVTSGAFTREAAAFATGRNIELINGRKLLSLLRDGRAHATSSAPPVPASPAKPVEASMPPPCPTCGSPMVERTARRGKHAGHKFWGCSTYPACKGIRPFD